MSKPNTEGFESFERLSGQLEGFFAENGHFRAMCPAHEGHRPALTITVKGEPPNRKILLHCHAECGKQEILDALEFTKGDLFERPRTKGKFPPIVETYDYVDLSGNLVSQTTRHEPKDFKQRRPDGSGGWIWSIKDIELPYDVLGTLLEREGIGYVVMPEPWSGAGMAHTFKAGTFIAMLAESPPG